MNRDITYCRNAACPYKDCWRNAEKLNGEGGSFIMANLGGTCTQFMDYLADKLNELIDSTKED